MRKLFEYLKLMKPHSNLIQGNSIITLYTEQEVIQIIGIILEETNSGKIIYYPNKEVSHD